MRGKRPTTRFTEKSVKVGLNHMKRCSTSPPRKMQKEITPRCYFLLVRLPKYQIFDNTVHKETSPAEMQDPITLWKGTGQHTEKQIQMPISRNLS